MPTCKNKHCNKKFDTGKGADGYCPDCAADRKAGAGSKTGKREASGMADHHTHLTSSHSGGGRGGGR
jgi:hypothetical protein